MSQFYIALAVIGTVVLALGLLSRPLNRSVLSIPLLACVFGVALGPLALDLLKPQQWGHAETLLKEAARLTLGFSIMGAALRVPRRYPLTHWRSLAVLLGLGMPLMFAASSAIAFWTLGLPVLVAMLVVATICPTDPVVAGSVVTTSLAEEKLPPRLRHTLSLESAANDGLAYPLVMLPVLLLSHTAGGAWPQWFTTVLLWEVCGGLVFGAILGVGVAWALRHAVIRETIDHPSFLSTTLAMTVLAIGLAKLLGTSSLLAVFAAGVAFDEYAAETGSAIEVNVQETAGFFFTLPVFVLFGAMLPLDGWIELGWSSLALVVLMLLFRRLPVIFLLRPILPSWREPRIALTGGWFGPIGIATLYYGLLVTERTGNDIAWTASSLMVAASLIAHGMSAAPVAWLYGRRYPPCEDVND